MKFPLSDYKTDNFIWPVTKSINQNRLSASPSSPLFIPFCTALCRVLCFARKKLRITKSFSGCMYHSISRRPYCAQLCNMSGHFFVFFIDFCLLFMLLFLSFNDSCWIDEISFISLHMIPWINCCLYCFNNEFFYFFRSRHLWTYCS